MKNEEKEIEVMHTLSQYTLSFIINKGKTIKMGVFCKFYAKVAFVWKEIKMFKIKKIKGRLKCLKM